MPSVIFHWTINLVEVLGVIAAILLGGLVLGLAAFRLLARIASMIAGVDPDSDPLDSEMTEDTWGAEPPAGLDDSNPEEPSVRGRPQP